MSFWFLEFLNITSHKAIVQLWSEYRTPEIWMHTKSGLFKFLAITCDQPNYLNSGLIGSVFEWCPKFLQKVQFSDNFWNGSHAISLQWPNFCCLKTAISGKVIIACSVWFLMAYKIRTANIFGGHLICRAILISH